MENGRLRYFIFNKRIDYERGYLKNLQIGEHGIRAMDNTMQQGAFFSRILDSKENEMSWHRLRFCGKEESKAVKVSIYAGNEESFVYELQEVRIEDFIKREDISLEEKKTYLSPWLQKQIIGKNDILLHEVKGRYLWILLEMYWQPDQKEIYDIQIFFPKQSWIEYLPEIYQREDSNLFLERYLGIFQTIYEDLNAKIRELPASFDMELAEKDYLIWLAEWLDIKESYIWSEKQQRDLLKRGVSLYKRGTCQGLLDFIELYTGERPFLVEQYQLRFFKKDTKRYEELLELYGEETYSFSVLVREEAVPSVWQQKALLKIIEEAKPAHTECNLVILRSYLFVGQHTYVGVNSVLGQYSSLSLDGHSAIPFTVLEQVKDAQI